MTATTAPRTPAHICLVKMKDEVFAEVKKTGSCTLSFWRFSQEDVWEGLVAFASSEDWNRETADEDACRKEVQKLFTKMNKGMLEQEQKFLWPKKQGRPPNSDQWSVVFGGKWAESPCSIAEQLVALLCATGGESRSPRVFTVSRSVQNDTDSPENVFHFQKENLEEDQGKEEFEDVLNKVIDKYEEVYARNGSEPEEKIRIVMYFTLAKHKGDNLPFQRNIQAAKNFVRALEGIVPSRLNAKGIPWKVVITGTDATCPSNQKDKDLGVVGGLALKTPITNEAEDEPEGVLATAFIDGDNGVLTTAPTYRVVPYNTVYAASKLCQFYSIAAAVARMIDESVPQPQPLPSTRKGNDGSLEAITKQLEDFVIAAGANGTYQKNDHLTDEELDKISVHWTKQAEPALKKYLQTAKDISICYTPLHRDPWTRMCLTDKSQESPKKYMIENIIWRLKNAISIDRAARAHL